MTPFKQVLFRFIFSNKTPRGNFHHILSCRDRFLIHRLENGRPLNLLAIIFCHLKESLIAFECGQSFHIPYGRILSTLLESTEVTQILRNAEFPDNNDMLTEESCE